MRNQSDVNLCHWRLSKELNRVSVQITIAR